MSEPTPDQEPSIEKLSTEHEVSLVSEFLQFLSENKKWWLAPILVVLLLLGALIVLSGTAAAPFIYTLF